MQMTHHHPSRRSGLLFSALPSVLVLLALACFPALAQAEDSTGIQYEDAPQTVTGTTVQPKSGGKAHTSNTDGSETVPGKSGSNTSGDGSSSGDASSATNPSTSDEGGKQQGIPGKASTGPQSSKQERVGTAAPVPITSSSDDSSSPLVPILIAIAALAAISIAVVVIRQRRQDGDGGGARVSPKASS